IAIEDVWNANQSELELSGRASLDSIQIKSFSREKTGWATQKNESVLRRIIEASSNPGDTVADLFAGSGTTAAVAAALGRRFIVCDHADAAVQIARNRLLEANVEFTLLESDGRERELSLAAIEAEHQRPAPELLREWMLDQLGADARDENPSSPLAGRRGPVGLALALPGQAITRATIEQLRACAREQGLAAIELLAFDWSIEVDAPEIIPVQVGRGLFEPSVRTQRWIDGGAAVWERPQIKLAVEPLADDRLRVELIDSQLRRPEHLPEPLRSRPFADRL